MVVVTLPTFHFSNFVLNFLFFDEKCGHRLLIVLFVPNDKPLFHMKPLVSELNKLSDDNVLLLSAMFHKLGLVFGIFKRNCCRFVFSNFFSYHDNEFK